MGPWTQFRTCLLVLIYIDRSPAILMFWSGPSLRFWKFWREIIFLLIKFLKFHKIFFLPNMFLKKFQRHCAGCASANEGPVYWHRIMHFSKRHLLNLFLLYSSLKFTFFMTKILFTSNIIYILIWHFFSPWVMMCEYVWERKRLWLMYFPLH